MFRFLMASCLLFFITSNAYADMSREEYFSMMKKGECWGTCAYLSSVEACIECGLPHHSSRRGVENYCRKLQPKCGRK